MTSLSLTVNGQEVTVEVEDRTLLVHFLRDSLRLTGTHVGCDTSQCGACVVHVNGRAVKSCTSFTVQAGRGSCGPTDGLPRAGARPPARRSQPGPSLPP